ncbi:MAG: class I SAM-dependent methyltransferase [Candidatus Omnitrophica bacterium]|nr:class I SAM-dependent methyltransferase [Candidatus Omnitrophota bacterium]
MTEKEYYIEYLKRTAKFPQSVYHRAKHDAVRKIFSNIAINARVLDAGCGIGHITGPYADRYSVFGIDEQESAVQYCCQRWKGTYVQASLYDIPFEDNFFDLIVFLDAIEHLNQPVAALRELARVLKPGASILICTMNYASPLWLILEHTWHRFMGGTCKPYSADVHPTNYTSGLLREHCAGLFEETSLRERIMGMEIFYLGKKHVATKHF